MKSTWKFGHKHIRIDEIMPALFCLSEYCTPSSLQTLKLCNPRSKRKALAYHEIGLGANVTTLATIEAITNVVKWIEKKCNVDIKTGSWPNFG